LASERAVQYCHLNADFAAPSDLAKIGTQVWVPTDNAQLECRSEALVAARTSVGIYFKLNAGRVGLASTPSAICRFEDVMPFSPVSDVQGC